MYTPITQVESLVCFHCGTSCGKDHRTYDEKDFCCLGCESVYKFLHREELDAYYRLTDHPGISPSQDTGGKYDYLLEASISDKLFDFKGPQLANITFSIPQIHCVSCVWLLEKLYALHPAIRHSRVNFSLRQITITFDHTALSLKELVQLLAVVGYEPEINLAAAEDIERGKRHAFDKKLYYQIGVAGFCFGNVMLISLPEYFDWDGVLGENFKLLFGYLNLGLSIPVLLYSAKDYFTSAWGAVRQRSLNLDVPLVVGMIALFLTSLFQILSETGPGYMDSFTGLIFFLLTGKAFQQKTYRHISFERDYKSYLPLSARIVLGEQISSVSLEKLKVGDRILVKHHEIIPADAILLKGTAWVDYSFVTGESQAVEKTLGEIVHAGGRHQGAAIELEVVKPTAASYFTTLWNYDVFNKKEEVLDTIANRAGRRFSYALFVISTLAFLYWLPDFDKAINVFAAVLIVACPCALALSSPYTFGNVIRILGRNKFYLKNTGVIEKIAAADTIVFDKTGTLTRTDEFEVRWLGEELSHEEKLYFSSLFSQSVHPLSKALFTHLGKDGLPVLNFKEIVGQGLEATVGNQILRAGSMLFILDKEKESQLLETTVYLELNGRVLGYFELISAFRPGLDQLGTQLSKHHFSVCSGDTPKDKNRLEVLLPSSTTYHFGQKPEEKLAYIQSLQAKGGRIMMVGDGLNDAGALKSSDVGIAISEGTGHFSPACDSILDASKFDRLPDFIRYSRWSVYVVYASFFISAAYNITGLSYAVQGLLSPVIAAIIMPLSSISVVVFTTLSTNMLARKLNLN